MTYSIAWVLARSPVFLQHLVTELHGGNQVLHSPTDVDIRIQTYEKHTVITDIEIEQSGHFHYVIEAKKGWNLPSYAQLEKYAFRLQKSKAR